MVSHKNRILGCILVLYSIVFISYGLSNISLLLKPVSAETCGVPIWYSALYIGILYICCFIRCVLISACYFNDDTYYAFNFKIRFMLPILTSYPCVLFIQRVDSPCKYLVHQNTANALLNCIIVLITIIESIYYCMTRERLLDRWLISVV